MQASAFYAKEMAKAARPWPEHTAVITVRTVRGKPSNDAVALDL
jgi:hypothetical protein